MREVDFMRERNDVMRDDQGNVKYEWPPLVHVYELNFDAALKPGDRPQIGGQPPPRCISGALYRRRAASPRRYAAGFPEKRFLRIVASMLMAVFANFPKVSECFETPPSLL